LHLGNHQSRWQEAKQCATHGCSFNSFHTFPSRFSPERKFLSMPKWSRSRPYLFLCLAILFCTVQLGFWIHYAPVNGSAISSAKSTATHSVINDLRHQPADQPAPRVLLPSTWSCTLGADSSKEARKSRQCVVRHACVDDQGNMVLSVNDTPWMAANAKRE